MTVSSVSPAPAGRPGGRPASSSRAGLCSAASVADGAGGPQIVDRHRPRYPASEDRHIIGLTLASRFM